VWSRTAVLAREVGGPPHQVVRHRKGRAGSERDPRHGPRPRIVVLADEPPRVGEDHVLRLHDVVRGQAALALAAAHRPARRVEADAEVAGGADLGVDETLVPAREEVEVVGGRRAAREQQLAEADARRHLHRFRVVAAPDLVQLDQPAEERRLLHARHVAGQGLREMMVRVDEAGQHDLAARVQAPVHRPGGALPMPTGRDAVVLDQDPSAGQTRRASSMVATRRASWMRRRTPSSFIR
jgi:hypothetical protein